MAQPAVRPTSSRSRLARSGMPSSRSGERLHMGAPSSGLGETSKASSSRSRTASSNGTIGKMGATTQKRTALSDKTNMQSGIVASQQEGYVKLANHARTASSAEGTLKHKAPNGTTTVALQQPAKARTTSSSTLTANNGVSRHERLGSASSSNGVKTVIRGAVNQNGAAVHQVSDEIREDSSSRTSAGTSSSFGASMDLDDGGSGAPTLLDQSSKLVDDTDMKEMEAQWANRTSQRGPFERGFDKDDVEDFSVENGIGAASAVTKPKTVEIDAMDSDEEEEEEEDEDEDDEEDDEEEVEEDDAFIDGGKEIIDEEEDEEDDADSLIVNHLDPECLVSLPPELEEIAQRKTAYICSRFEEQFLHPQLAKAASEREEAVRRGELDPDLAAHDEELAQMGLDPEEVRDTSMVAEYSQEIFGYMAKCENRAMPNPNYMDFQGEIRWHMRATLVDWLMQVHMRYHMLPETLWIAVNIVDRFLSARVVSLAKLQLVGVTAMFVAAKYEEILAPSVDEFVYMTEKGYTRDEILKGERIILTTLEYNISTYCSPYSWVRKISKADDYDIRTRTLSKFLMEVTLFDHRFLRAKPSLVAAVGMFLAKKMLGGEWEDGFVYYSSFVEEQLVPGANLLLEKLIDPAFEEHFVCRKYANKKFLKASTFARDWAKRNHEALLQAAATGSQ